LSARSSSSAVHSAPIFAALGDATRLRLVSRLCNDGPASITCLAAGTNITRQAITKHLHVMEHAGLAHSIRHGRESIWQLNEHRLKEARFYLDQISKRWDDALGQLQKFVEH